jgi:hypothetical protein
MNKNGVDLIINELEQRRNFKYKIKNDFHGGDVLKILTEADMSRLIFRMISKITLKNMSKFCHSLVGVGDLDHGKAFTQTHLDHHASQTFLDFIKSHHYLVDESPLYSKVKARRGTKTPF